MAKLSAVSLPTGDGLTRYNPSSPLSGGDLLGSYQTTKALGRWLAFPPKLARLIGIEETIFLLNLMYMASEEEGWVLRSWQQLKEDTSLSLKQQKRVRKRLEGLGLIKRRINRREHQTFYKVVEENYDKLIETLWAGKKRAFAESTKGPLVEGTEGKVTEVPKGSSLLREEVREEKKEEEKPLLLPLCKEERRAIPKPVREPKVRRGFQKTLPPKREYVTPPKPPEDWDWFARTWQSRADCLPLRNRTSWEELEARLMYFTKEQIEERMSRWLDEPGRKITGWSALDFLRDCALMSDKEAGDIQSIVNEE